MFKGTEAREQVACLDTHKKDRQGHIKRDRIRKWQRERNEYREMASAMTGHTQAGTGLKGQ
jgi:hypothetical protein